MSTKYFNIKKCKQIFICKETITSYTYFEKLEQKLKQLGLL